MTTDHNTRLAWSYLTDEPVLYRGTQGVIVHWHGFITNFKTALVASGYFIDKVYATPKMSQECWDEFRSMYDAGDFAPESDKWDLKYFTEPNVYKKYVNNTLAGHFLKMTDGGRKRFTIAEVLGWFDQSRIMENFDDTNS